MAVTDTRGKLGCSSRRLRRPKSLPADCLTAGMRRVDACFCWLHVAMRLLPSRLGSGWEAEPGRNGWFLPVTVAPQDRSPACLSSGQRAPCSGPSHNVAIFRRRGRRRGVAESRFFSLTRPSAPSPLMRSAACQLHHSDARSRRAQASPLRLHASWCRSSSVGAGGGPRRLQPVPAPPLGGPLLLISRSRPPENQS